MGEVNAVACAFIGSDLINDGLESVDRLIAVINGSNNRAAEIDYRTMVGTACEQIVKKSHHRYAEIIFWMSDKEKRPPGGSLISSYRAFISRYRSNV